MEESTLDIIGIIIASIIFFIIPIILIADTTDDISELIVQNATAEFVDDAIKTGQITTNRYNRFIKSLLISGNSYDIDIQIKVLDENTSQYETNLYGTIGSNTYYSLYTSQIEEKLLNNSEKLVLKQGDEISVNIKNNGKTISQVLKSFYYKVTGSEIHIISATASGTITVNGIT